jgi:stage II sporulation protein P
MGTYESRKEEAQKSTQYLADVIQKAMFGGTFQQKDQQGRAQGPVQRVRPINEARPQGGSRGILWVLLALVIGAAAFLFISTGGREMTSKVRKFTRQEFSGFLGRKKQK